MKFLIFKIRKNSQITSQILAGILNLFTFFFYNVFRSNYINNKNNNNNVGLYL